MTLALMQDLFVASLGILIYIYLGYPLALAMLARLCGRAHQQGSAQPSVTIVVAAHQEAAVIRDKVENLEKLDYPHDKLRMLVVSDGSTDGTDELVTEFGSERVTLMRQEPRAGKASALHLAIAKVDSEIVVFTDANVLFDAQAIKALVRHFADPTVGAVTGVVQLVDSKTGYAESEGAYYRYERFLQQAESDLHSVVGVDGALYAAKLGAISLPPRHAILDDFVLSMNIGRTGARIIYDPQARAREDAAPGVGDEFRRKVRVATGAFQSFFNGWGVPGLRTPKLTWCYWSHKVLRWFGPLFLILCFVSNAALAGTTDQWASLFVLQCMFYGLALLGLQSPGTRGARVVAIPMYFTMMNAAFALGLYRYLRSGTSGSWQPTARSRIDKDKAS